MDEKLDERDRQKPAPRAANPEAIQRHKDNIAHATAAWKQLSEDIKSDIAKWNARTPEQRLNVSATAETIGVFWLNAPQEVLMVSRKSSETTVRYESPQTLGRHGGREGSIDLLTADATSLSERLLSPVLFP